MMTKYDPMDAKLHPCTMRFKGVLCEGYAYRRRVNGLDRYVCSTCGWSWTAYGNPAGFLEEPV